MDGTPVGGRPEAAARGIALVPQGNGLAAVLTAYENIVVPLLDGGRVVRARRTARAREALEVVGLEEWAEHLVEELSGGQQQRVAVARALAARASVLLADEPTSDLDGRNREVVLTALRAAADRGRRRRAGHPRPGGRGGGRRRAGAGRRRGDLGAARLA